MDVKKEITGCFHNCSFYNRSMDGMECDHPYFRDKPSYSNMIIEQKHISTNLIPEKCPLLSENLRITYYIRKEERGDING